MESNHETSSSSNTELDDVGFKTNLQGTIYKQKVSRVGVVVSSILKSFINLEE